MEEFGWFNQHQQEIDETIMFGSENIFLNPIQPGSSPTTRQLPPARLDSVNAASSFGSASQYWRQTLTVNNLHKGKNVIPLTPTTATATATDTATPDYVDDISVIFSDYQNLRNKIIKNQSVVVSSDASVTKQTDDVIEYSQCSSEENPNYNSGFYENSPPRSKRHKPDPVQYSTSSTLNFRQTTDSDDTDSDVTAQMKEMIYRAAAFRPVSFSGDEVVEKPRRNNVRISSDPQTAAARRRREKISDRIRVLQKLVPGGNKMDTASMLDEAANYLKFLRSQVKAFEQFGQKFDYLSCGASTNAHGTSQNIIHNVTLGVPFPMQTPFLPPYQQIYPTLPPS